MRTGQGFILMFSMTSRLTFEDLTSLYKRILEVKDSERVPLVIVGNKADLVNERKVSVEEATELAKQLDVPFLLGSAKTRTNVEEALHSTCTRNPNLP